MRRAALAVALAAVVLAGSNSLAAASGPTGDAMTIAYVKAIDANLDAQRGVQVTETGYVTFTSRGGATPTFSYRWGFGTVPAGSVPAREAITYAQHGGQVVWVADVLTANDPDCASSASCRAIVPVELMATRTAAFAGVVDGPDDAVSCFHRESFDAVPYRAGGRWWTAVGDYRPMVERGNQRLVTDTYAWGDGQHVTEIDSINVARRVVAASIFHVGRGAGPREVPFSFAQQVTVLAATPVAPHVTVCS